MRSTHYITYLFAKWACVWIQLHMDRKRREILCVYIVIGSGAGRAGGAEAPPLFSGQSPPTLHHVNVAVDSAAWLYKILTLFSPMLVFMS